MSATAPLAPALIRPIFIVFMVVVLIAALGISQILDPPLWKPKPSGLGWTVDIRNPHAKYLGLLAAAWTAVVVIGLGNPDAPGVSVLTHFIAGLISR